MRIFFLSFLLFTGCARVAAVSSEQTEKEPAVVRAAECRRVEGTIKLDGVLDEAAWAKAEVLKDFAVYWQKRSAVTATKARLLWDDSHLYFAAEMVDRDLFALEKEFNGKTWEDDVFELFFKPSEKRPDYYEFQVNALGTHLELYLPSRGAGGYRRFAPLMKPAMQSVVIRKGTLNKYDDRDTGWTVEGRIPWSVFKPTGGAPKPGAKWRFALCRYDYSVDLERQVLSSTAPLSAPDFHRYEDYGVLTFTGK